MEKSVEEQLAEANATIAEMKAKMRTAHDELTWLAVELNWATDGDLLTAVRHVKELVRKRDETIETLRNLTVPF